MEGYHIMDVLVTGGSGFIGSHVAKLLSEKDYNPVIIDNLSQGHREFARWGTFYRGDIGDANLLDKIFSEHEIDGVMHFAALAQVGESVKDPARYYENNVSKTHVLLSSMLRHGIRNFVFSSTCAVYGLPEVIPISEEHSRSPINPYGRTKLAVEHMLEDFSRAYGLRYVSLRYFNAAGADHRAGIGEDHRPETHLIPLILDVALGRRKEIEIFGTDYKTRDGTCIRDYIHVSDLAEAHLLALNYLREGGDSDAFNLGTGKGYSVKEVVEATRRITGREIKVRIAPRREGDPPVLIADPSKAWEVLNWRQRYTEIGEIIESAWEWHRMRFGGGE